MLNKIMMTGRITTDLSVVTEEDRSYCKFCIAVDQPKQKGVDTVETDTFTCLAFDDNAKSVNFQNRFAVEVDVDSWPPITIPSWERLWNRLWPQTVL